MARRLSTEAEEMLDKKYVPTIYELRVSGTLINPMAYNYSYNREFGAASLSFTLDNSDGRYSTGGSQFIQFNDEIELKEGLLIDGSTELFTKFTGYVRQASPQISTGGLNVFVVKCLDKIVKLEDMDIDKVFESTVAPVSDEALRPLPISGTSDLAQVFDFAHSNIATTPPPQMTVISKDAKSAQPVWQGFEIIYETGQLILGSAINYEKFDIYASYSYYDPINASYVEDIMEELMTEPDAYGNNIFTVAGNLTETFSSWEGKAYDDLSPIASAGTIDVKTVLKQATASNATQIFVENTDQFDSTGYMKIGDDVMQYGGIWRAGTPHSIVLSQFLNQGDVIVFADTSTFDATGYIKIDNEIIKYIDKTATQFGQSGSPVLRGQFNTREVSHNIDATVDAYYPVGFYDVTHSLGVIHNLPVTVNQYYPANQVFKFSYNNISDNMVSGDFTIPGGRSIIRLPDASDSGIAPKRYGLVVLDEPHSGAVKGDVRYNGSYDFKTLQATGIQINRIEFRDDKISNRFDCIVELQKQLAPNYIIRSLGTDKVWGSFLFQKDVEDYEIKLKESINWIGDDEIFSRVKIFGKNASPHNLMLDLDNDNNTVAKLVGEDPDYIQLAIKQPLTKRGTASGYEIFTVGDGTSNQINEILQYPVYPMLFVNNSRYLPEGDSDDLTVTVETSTYVPKPETNDDGWGFKGIRAVRFQHTIKSSKTIIFYEKGKFLLPSNIVFTIPAGRSIAVQSDKYGYVKYNGVTDDKDVQTGAIWRVGNDVSEDVWDQIYAGCTVVYYNDLGNSWYLGHFIEPETGSKVPAFYVKTNSLIGEIPKNKGIISSTIRDSVHISGDRINNPENGFDGSEQTKTSSGHTFAGEKSSIQIDLIDTYYVDDFTMKYWYSAYVAPVAAVKMRINFAIEGWNVNSSDVDKWTLLSKVSHHIYQAGGFLNNPIGVFIEPDGNPTTATAKDEGVGFTPMWINKVRIRIYSDSIPGKTYFVPFSCFAYIHDFQIKGYDNFQPSDNVMSATFHFKQRQENIDDWKDIMDGSYSTALQTDFGAWQPVKGLTYLKFDLGSIQDIDAIDLLTGWYKPFENRSGTIISASEMYGFKHDLTIQYSTDDVNYYPICDGAEKFSISEATLVSFEKSDLGDGFQARYLKIIIEDSTITEIVNKYLMSIIEFSVWSKSTLIGEATLVENEGDESTTTVWDRDGILDNIKDKVFKDMNINQYLSSQEKINYRAKTLLKEFYKNHTKASVSSVSRPDSMIGDSVRVIDPINNINDIYFVEGVSNNGGKVVFNIARYPS